MIWVFFGSILFNTTVWFEFFCFYTIHYYCMIWVFLVPYYSTLLYNLSFFGSILFTTTVWFEFFLVQYYSPLLYDLSFLVPYYSPQWFDFFGSLYCSPLWFELSVYSPPGAGWGIFPPPFSTGVSPWTESLPFHQTFPYDRIQGATPVEWHNGGLY